MTHSEFIKSLLEEQNPPNPLIVPIPSKFSEEAFQLFTEWCNHKGEHEDSKFDMMIVLSHGSDLAIPRMASLFELADFLQIQEVLD